MRFKTRYDGWILAVLVVAGVIQVGIPASIYLGGAVPAKWLWIFLVGPLAIGFVLWMTLPQYYDVREDGLFIRQGWRKAVLPYADLNEMRAEDGVLSAPVFSLHRIYLNTTQSGQWVIAVAEQDRFLAEVKTRAPQLK
ncbi:MAG: PH domain-containing protein [Acidobacteriota bacterium]